MNHDPAMQAMMTSTWFLMLIPFAFVVIGVLWYRQSMEGQERRDEVETR